MVSSWTCIGYYITWFYCLWYYLQIIHIWPLLTGNNFLVSSVGFLTKTNDFQIKKIQIILLDYIIILFTYYFGKISFFFKTSNYLKKKTSMKVLAFTSHKLTPIYIVQCLD